MVEAKTVRGASTKVVAADYLNTMVPLMHVMSWEPAGPLVPRLRCPREFVATSLFKFFGRFQAITPAEMAAKYTAANFAWFLTSSSRSVHPQKRALAAERAGGQVYHLA